MKNIPLLLSFLIWSSILGAQNLPSLLSEKNINATFSILAYDAEAQEWGIAVATNNIYVGNSTVYIEPGVGAFSVIAETEPDYALNGFQQLKAGQSIKDAILFTKEKDSQHHYRQVSGIDKDGNVFAFTGETLKFWKGKADHLIGDKFVVMGNQLDVKVLENMAEAFNQTKGTLAERLLKGLIAGQLAGGQVSGKQSAALVVKGSKNKWYNQIDLRVDHSRNPIKELQNLLDYHYGRIRINQANYAIRLGNRTRATSKLEEAEVLLEGWDGMYGKIAITHTLLGQDEEAIKWIKKALLLNPQWKVNLPAFYYLRKHKAILNLIDSDTFSLKDWEAAIGMLISLGRSDEAIQEASQLINKGKESSYLYYLLGKAYRNSDRATLAIQQLEKALDLDHTNREAAILLEELKK